MVEGHRRIFPSDYVSSVLADSVKVQTCWDTNKLVCSTRGGLYLGLAVRKLEQKAFVLFGGVFVIFLRQTSNHVRLSWQDSRQRCVVGGKQGHEQRALWPCGAKKENTRHRATFKNVGHRNLSLRKDSPISPNFWLSQSEIHSCNNAKMFIWEISVLLLKGGELFDFRSLVNS